MIYGKISDKKWNGFAMSCSVEEEDHSGLGSYKLTEEERLAVMAINASRGLDGLVDERNKEIEERCGIRRNLK